MIGSKPGPGIWRNGSSIGYRVYNTKSNPRYSKIMTVGYMNGTMYLTRNERRV